MNELSRVVFAESPVGMALVGADFRFVRVNEAFVRITGYPEDELVGRTFLAITHPHDAHDNELLARRLLDGETARYAADQRYLHKDGHIVWVTATVSLVREPAGGPLSALVTVQDVSETKRAESELRALARAHEESERRYRQILDAIDDLVFVKDRSSHLMWGNRAFCDFFGYDPERIVGVLDSPTNPPENTRGYLATDALVLATSSTQQVEREKGMRRDGVERLLNTVKSPLFDGAGNVSGLVGVARDVTERVALQEELDRKTARFEALIEGALDMILVIDQGGAKRFVSPSVERILGWRLDEVLGQDAFDVVHPDDLAAVLEAFARCVAAPGNRGSVEFRRQHRDGSWRYLEAVGHNCLDDPAVRGIVVNARDVTARRLAEEALAKSERYFRAVIEHCSDVITVLEPEGTVRYESPAVTRVLGYRPDELVGTSMLEIVHPDDAATLAEAFARGLADPGASTVIPPQRYRCRHKSGAWVVLEGTGSVRIDDPDVRGIIGSARDVTDRVRAEIEREELIAKLQSALGEVKTLSGLLPICASCKRIRDDSGYWQQIEQYVREHTGASFSHGICPACAERLYPDLVDESTLGKR